MLIFTASIAVPSAGASVLERQAMTLPCILQILHLLRSQFCSFNGILRFGEYWLHVSGLCRTRFCLSWISKSRSCEFGLPIILIWKLIMIILIWILPWLENRTPLWTIISVWLTKSSWIPYGIILITITCIWYKRQSLLWYLISGVTSLLNAEILWLIWLLISHTIGPTIIIFICFIDFIDCRSMMRF